MLKEIVCILGLGLGLSAYADMSNIESVTNTVNDGSVAITSYKTTVSVSGADASQPLFAGEAMGCSKPSTPNAIDCCAPATFGKNQPQNYCTSQEQLLANARSAGLAVYVGDTCIEVNGVCVSPLSVYCVFPDKVAYQMQTAGRAQLNLDFGTAAAPNCNGLSSQQIKQVDLTDIKFNQDAYS